MRDGTEVVSWRVVFTKQAEKDAVKLARAGLKPKAQELLEILATDLLQAPPPFEILIGDLAGAYSRRINIQHRLVYRVVPDKMTVQLIRMWTHYE